MENSSKKCNKNTGCKNNNIKHIEQVLVYLSDRICDLERKICNLKDIVDVLEQRFNFD